MSLVVSDRSGASIPPLNNGVYLAICSALIDVGKQYSEQYKKANPKIMIQWTIIGEDFELNGELIPRKIHKEYTATLSEKGNLRKALEAWRGKAFTDDELDGFNTVNVLNVPCQLQLITKERVGKNSYNEIAGIMALPKGQKVEKLAEEQLLMLDFDDINTFKYFKDIPKWIQDRIKQATNYEESGLKKYVEENIKEDNDEVDGEYITVEDTDDLPF